ncbi:hypothetical protein Wcon_01913 [Wolbachia endosymbiont of Cylisticus convexus]|uniref:hypothetical protein n=1 Tax=Wolbachia endosymbiont of Cylisticus convexus TaxID=118728 RepID=UPI000DF6BA9C|nr:hypothetical protein [Wolbachia endosymbiont of Cylisticus convexus]RDD34050.1 hypothetical protein Wcon_01913 [Wolbachia endosymbiont of Cylisticus convexus]
MIGNVERLQRELLEEMGSISLGSSNTRALEIVNQLGEDHINDTIMTLDGRQFTALDCAIMFDSQGNNSRINNSAFRELEGAIRSAKGRTSEELGRVQNISVDLPSTFLTDVTVQPIMEGRRFCLY